MILGEVGLSRSSSDDDAGAPLPMMKLMRFQQFCFSKFPWGTFGFWFDIPFVFWVFCDTQENLWWWWVMMIVDSASGYVWFLGLRSKWGTPQSLDEFAHSFLGSPPSSFFLGVLWVLGKLCVCLFFFLVCLFGFWVWKSGAGAALILLLSFPIHLSGSLTGYLFNWFCPRAFPFIFLIPWLGYLCNWFCPRAFHSPFWFLDWASLQLYVFFPREVFWNRSGSFSFGFPILLGRRREIWSSDHG